MSQRLSSELIEKLEGMLSMGGWREVMKPIISQRRDAVRDMAMLLPSERPEPYSKRDDREATALLKGENRSLEWVLAVFENEVAVARRERMLADLARQNGGAGVGEPAQPPAPIS